MGSTFSQDDSLWWTYARNMPERTYYLAWRLRRWSLLYLAFHPSRARADRVPDDVQ
jgi:hypothetical protein